LLLSHEMEDEMESYLSHSLQSLVVGL
jgi:hypothetical protein